MAVSAEKKELTYALIRTGGKQYRVSEGQKLTLNRVTAKPGETIQASEVLFVSAKAEGQEDRVLIGTPLVAGASVTLRVLSHQLDKKVKIFKKKRRTGYTKRQGHRQQLTRAVVESITIPA